MNNPTQPPPDREAQIAQLVAYLEQHRAEYTLVALRKQLLESGHPHPLVDEALRRLNGGKEIALSERPRTVGFLLSFVNLILLSYVSLFAAPLLDNMTTRRIYAVIGVLVVELLVVAALRNSPSRRGISRILLWTVIWTLVLGAIAILIIGICTTLQGNAQY
jgi:cytochrome bd-type quinol oxidase subunit 1